MADYRGYRGERDDFETDDLRYRHGYRQQQGERMSRGWQGGDMGGGRGYGEGGWGQQGGGMEGERGYAGRDQRDYGSQQSAFERGGSSQYGGGYGESRSSQSGYGDIGYAERSGASRFGEDRRGGGYGAGMGPRSDFGYESGDSGDYAGRGYGSSYERSYGAGPRSSRRSYGGGDRGYEQGGRDFWDRAADEVSSWFGDEDAERRRRMDQFRGRGPKNYMRSDERIKEDVNDRLSDDGNLDASDIEVAVSKGEVTLSGQISNRWDKRRAEDIAEAVSGVKHVQNNLRVRETTTQTSGATTGVVAGGLTGTTGRTASAGSRDRSTM